jgi:hypothetical protein
MAEEDQITIENLSAAPIEEENETPVDELLTIQIGGEQEGAEKGFMNVPGETEGTTAEAPVEEPKPAEQPRRLTPVTRTAVDTTQGMPASQYATVPMAVKPEQVQKSITSKAFIPKREPYVPPQERMSPEEIKDAGLDFIPPTNYTARTFKSDEEHVKAIREMGAFYMQKALTKNLPKNSSVEKRIGHVNKAFYFRVPRLDDEGNVIMLEQVDPKTGRTTTTPEYLTDLIEMNAGNLEPTYPTEMKLIEMFEYSGGPNNGAYYLFDENGGIIGGIDIGLQKMQRDAQNPIEWLYRHESEESGMSNLIKAMKTAGVTNPARLRYYADKNIESGAFTGVEGFRTKSDPTDIGVWLGKFGFGQGWDLSDVGIDAKIGFGQPMIDHTSKMHAYMSNLTLKGFLQDMNPAAPARTPEEMYGMTASGVNLDDNLKGKIIRNVEDTAKGKIKSIELFYAHEDLKKAYPDATDLEIDAYRNYSKDMVTRAKRFTVETLATAPVYMAGLFRLGVTEYRAFQQFAAKKLGLDRNFKDDADMFAELEKSKKPFAEMLAQFYEDRGTKGLIGSLVARGLDARLQNAARKGPFRDYVVDSRIAAIDDEIAVLAKKLDLAKKENKSKDYIQRLSANLNASQRNKRDMLKQYFIPPVIKESLKDEAIAIGFQAAAYQYVYENITEHNDQVANLAALVGGVMSTMQSVRGSLGEAWAMFMRNPIFVRDKDRRTQLKLSRQMIKSIENTAPALRERILAGFEYSANVQDRLSVYKFAKGHSKEGQNIFPDDLVEQSIAITSGIATLNRTADEIVDRDLNVVKDIGKLSKRMVNYEKILENQAKLQSAFGDLIENFRLLSSRSDFDPASPEGIFARTMIELYENKTKSLETEMSLLQDVMKGMKDDMQSFLNADMAPKTLREYLDGRRQLSELISADMSRSGVRDLPPNATLQQHIDARQSYMAGVQAQLEKSLTAATKFQLDPVANGRVSNDMLLKMLGYQEDYYYSMAGARFDAIRDNEAYAGVRIDITSDDLNLIDMFTDPDSPYGFDAIALAQAANFKGAPASLRLNKKIADKGVAQSLADVIEDSAVEYVSDLRNKLDNNLVNTILEKARPDGDINLESGADQYFAIREFFDHQRKLPVNDKDRVLSDARIEELYPRLGVDVSTYMNIVSALGKRGESADAGSIRWLRNKMLTLGETDAYDNFYGPKSQRNSVPGFAEDYATAREYWRNNYWSPFRGRQSKVVGRILRAPDEQTQLNALDQLINELLVSKKGVTKGELNQPGGFFSVLRGINGGEAIDVNKGIGFLISKVLTAKAYEEISRTRGAIKLRRDLVSDYSSKEFAGSPGMSFDVKSVLINPRMVRELDKAIQNAPTDTPLLNNLLSGAFVDDFGNPLINHRIAETINFDAGLALGHPKFEKAAKELEGLVDDAAADYLAKLKDAQSVERKELITRQKLVESMAFKGGPLGQNLLQIADSPLGIQTVKRMREEFIESATQGRLLDIDGKPYTFQIDEEEAGKLFDDVIRDATINEIMQVIKPGVKDPTVATKVISEAQDIPAIYKERMIDGNALGQVLGIRGSTEKSSIREDSVRFLLGKDDEGNDVYEHMVFAFDQLYDPSKVDSSMNLTGISRALSGESIMSRGTSWARGVISARWLVSEAAIRKARLSNYEFTRLTLTDPKVGREVMQMIAARDFDLGKREPDFVAVLIDTIAKADAIQAYASEETQNRLPEIMPDISINNNGSGVGTQMDQLNLDSQMSVQP